MSYAIWLTVGLLIGAVGTLIGAGGGFLLMPILLFAYPGVSPGVLTAWSLLAVLFNSGSGTIAYARSRRIDYRAGIVFALAALPGAWFGAQLTSYLSRSWFALLFGGFLMVVSTLLLFRSTHRVGSVSPIKKALSRLHLWLGAALSLLVGLVSNVFGIGGGILHVPLLVYILGFPTHIATATSHFVLVITVLVGVLAHVASGTLPLQVLPLIPLLLGISFGAQVGAHYSNRLSGPWIIRSLAIGLAAVGLRLIVNR
jgi:uncharacterized membrane protein YfcA